MTNQYETIYKSDPYFYINQDCINTLINEINNELARLLKIFGENNFSTIVPLLVDALTYLEDCIKINHELSSLTNELKSDLKCLEEQYDKEKLSRKQLEDKLLKRDFENEDEVTRLNGVIKDKDSIINRLCLKIKTLNSELFNKSLEGDSNIETKYNHLELVTERNKLRQKVNELESVIREAESVKAASLIESSESKPIRSISKVDELMLAEFTKPPESPKEELTSEILSIPNFSVIS